MDTSTQFVEIIRDEILVKIDSEDKIDIMAISPEENMQLFTLTYDQLETIFDFVCYEIE